ncbi:hypothetical protein [Mesorhizobium sp. WSM4904]|uniref:outer membrane protein n=1 Tax=Mesorhizobium sp. WSM4904 TaxID=3038545 RepID=UPI0024188671|nr:hypothetical protein [Mesorhizobium sp. WSM4904]WFP63198.1 hypothetical protein QAZ47_01035 [Mesorhizobium sp. WSM4904]
MGGIAIASILPMGALADDVSTAEPTPVAAAVYDWSGWYGGVNLGYGWGRTRAAFTGDGLSDYWTTGMGPGAGTEFVQNLMAYAYNLDPEFDPFSQPLVYTQSFTASGVSGGVQLGHNWQVSSSWLVGLETDLQLSGIRGGTEYVEPDKGPQGVRLGASSSQRLDWFGTARGRVGYLPDERPAGLRNWRLGLWPDQIGGVGFHRRRCGMDIRRSDIRHENGLPRPYHLLRREGIARDRRLVRRRRS